MSKRTKKPRYCQSCGYPEAPAHAYGKWLICDACLSRYGAQQTLETHDPNVAAWLAECSIIPLTQEQAYAFEQLELIQIGGVQ